MRRTDLQDPIRHIHERLQLHFDREWLEEMMLRSERNGPWDHWTLYQLAYQTEQTGLIHSFDELQCLKHIPQIVPMQHQIETAQKVLNEMRGRAILADEVGLGKTIEAGLILKEYILRGLVKKGADPRARLPRAAVGP